jgi:serine phosphatase RsbU (regulator of sigma subunit)
MCDFNFDTLTMQFAGANSNIYIVRNKEIQIYKGDKQPIGESYTGTIINYTNQEISLQKNDCVYLISDGYADQFGGEKGKKFKYKQLENLFCSISDKDVKEQREILSIAFDDWKSNHEQVDDVLIMGIKI